MVQLGVKPEKMQKVFLKWFKRSLEDDFNLRNFYKGKVMEKINEMFIFTSYEIYDGVKFIL